MIWYELHLGKQTYRHRNYELLRQIIAQYDVDWKIYKVIEAKMNTRQDDSFLDFKEYYYRQRRIKINKKKKQA